MKKSETIKKLRQRIILFNATFLVLCILTSCANYVVGNFITSIIMLVFAAIYLMIAADEIRLIAKEEQKSKINEENN